MFTRSREDENGDGIWNSGQCRQQGRSPKRQVLAGRGPANHAGNMTAIPKPADPTSDIRMRLKPTSIKSRGGASSCPTVRAPRLESLPKIAGD